MKVAEVWRNRLECFSHSNVELKEPFSLICNTSCFDRSSFCLISMEPIKNKYEGGQNNVATFSITDSSINVLLHSLKNICTYICIYI